MQHASATERSENTESTPSDRSAENGQAAPALVVQNIHKRFGNLEVLKGISLTANEGDRHRAHRLQRLGQKHLPALHQSAGNAG